MEVLGKWWGLRFGFGLVCFKVSYSVRESIILFSRKYRCKFSVVLAFGLVLIWSLEFRRFVGKLVSFFGKFFVIF